MPCGDCRATAEKDSSSWSWQEYDGHCQAPQYEYPRSRLPEHVGDSLWKFQEMLKEAEVIYTKRGNLSQDNL